MIISKYSNNFNCMNRVQCCSKYEHENNIKEFNNNQNKAYTNNAKIISFYGENPNAYLSKIVNTKEFRNLILESISDSENLLGVGKEAKAYRIKEHPQLVIRIPKKNLPITEEDLKDFKYTPKFTTRYNYGQTLYSTDKGLEIKDYVRGQRLSIENSPKKVIEKLPVTEEEALSCFDLLKTFADFPLYSYVDFASKIKELHDTDQSIDYLSPNNILIDTERKEFNIIDLWDKEHHKITGKSGFVHMATLLCDGILSEELHKVMPKDKLEEYIALNKKVISKCYMASQLVKLPYGKDDFLSVIQPKKKLCQDLTERHNWFFEKYNI